MNPADLIGPASPMGYPAPYWFLVTFKVLGFTLHTSFMNLWFAGPLLALLLWRRGGNLRTWADRIMKQMPIIVAFGINFGIVPLLFLQVAYHRVFYPSTILMAWPWLSIIVFLTLAYYGVYLYATGLRRDRVMTPFKRFAGWFSAGMFIIIGFIFSNEFTLLTNINQWYQLWQTNNTAGAVLGLSLNLADPTLWPRYFMMFGLALMTTAAYAAVDCGLFDASASDEYKHWAPRFALKLYIVGAIWFAVMASWYMFGAWPEGMRQMVFSSPTIIFVALVAALPILTWILILLLVKKGQRTVWLSVAIGLSQFLVIGANAITRQIVQNAELRQYIDVTAHRVDVQWSSMILFLLLFLVGVGILIWMIMQIQPAKRQPPFGTETP